jgi:hypothetical protein
MAPVDFRALECRKKRRTISCAVCVAQLAIPGHAGTFQYALGQVGPLDSSGPSPAPRRAGNSSRLMEPKGFSAKAAPVDAKRNFNFHGRSGRGQKPPRVIRERAMILVLASLTTGDQRFVIVIVALYKPPPHHD